MNYEYLKLRTANTGEDTSFNLSGAGSVGTSNSNHTASIESVGDGWYLCVITSNSTNNRFSIYAVASDNANSASGDSIYIWGAHLYRSDLGGMVNNPETGDSYVRTASRVIGSELVTNATFDNGTTGWTGNSATLSSVSGQLVVTPTTTNATAYTSVSLVVGKTYRIQATLVNVNGSTNAKQLQVGTTITGNQMFSLSLGTTPQTLSGTFVATATTGYVNVYNYDGTNAVVWDNISVKEVDVNPATVRYLPRVGHHIYNGSAWVNEGVLHESEARTNLLTYSEDFTNASWSKNVTVTLETSATVSPSQAYNSYKIVNTTGYRNRVAASNVGVNDRVASVYAKAGEYNWLYLLSTNGSGYWSAYSFDLSTGSLGSGYSISTPALESANIEPIGNGWYRCSIVGNSSHGSNFAIMVGDSNGVPWGTTFGTSGGIYIYGAQVEAGLTPSSYIPTSGSTVTRAAETLTVSAANMPWPTPVAISSELGSQVIADWTAVASTLTDNGNGTWNLTDSDGGIGYINDQLTGLTVGNVYQVTSTVTNNTTSGNLTLQVGTSVGSAQIASTYITADTNGTLTFQFVATATSHFLGFRASAFVAGDGFDFTPISVKEINPLSVSIQMDGRMTFADDDSNALNPYFFNWEENSSNRLNSFNRTNGTYRGAVQFQQRINNVNTSVGEGTGSAGSYTEGVNVPFNIASRHGSTFINGAIDGTSLTANTTPTALPDLSTTDLNLASDFMGTIGKFRVWSNDLTDTGIEEAST